MAEVELMGKRKLKREAEERAKAAARKIREPVRDVATKIAPKAREIGETVGAKASDIRGDIGTRTKETRRKVGYWIAGEEPPKRPTKEIVIAAGAGAIAAFFLDPVNGRRRRSVARDWLLARLRRAGTGAAGATRGIAARAQGIGNRVVHLDEASQPENDQTLEQKVQSEMFQGLGIPSGQININAEEGVIVLRGAVERPDHITEVERRVRAVAGVRDVRNLLHLQGTPAPTTPA